MEKNIKDPVKAENPTGFSVIVREFKKDKLALFSFFAVTIFIIAVFVASSFINLQQLQTVDIFRKYEVPSFNNFWNFFGRDSGGRSVMGYVIVGARNSITIGVIITIVTTFIGLFVGLCMGYYGGKVDALGMRIVDFISIMPSVMIIIVFVSIVPKYGIFQFILIFSMFYWTRTTRLARSKTLSETRRDYVNASKTMGTSDLKIMFGEILPNISSIIIVNGTLALASNIGIEVALSFLGFGLPAATPSLGTLISYASKPEIIQYKAYVWLPAALVLLFMMLGINYIGQALRRAADAKQRLG
ncbi:MULTISPECIES: ABC transporter permease [Fusobacterium]|jgi:oligopeptide transport system permease oppC|uniref:ABC transporter permease n=3 Tax=Fusobacterium TaxID=848 RepID=A0AAD0HVW7_9FUSO|nr:MULTISPECIES: ABC transporter permease [Fusobacterium]ATV34713.1 ABC transporter permease [Fusobacterium pseudoperiodonticum]ATV62394.1 ABC transporter permease [Fusobacterium pseudoperiodonticum]AVQ25387.1 ABC transporter permease [Fusobacterium periodonticum]KGE63837.1 peptide/nickel transport system permease [Fusobacterium periodonticum 2_1_31]